MPPQPSDFRYGQSPAWPGPAATLPDCRTPRAFWVSGEDRGGSTHRTKIMWRFQPGRCAPRTRPGPPPTWLSQRPTRCARDCRRPGPGWARHSSGDPTRDGSAKPLVARMNFETAGSGPFPRPPLRPGPGTASRTRYICTISRAGRCRPPRIPLDLMAMRDQASGTLSFQGTAQSRRNRNSTPGPKGKVPD